MVKAKQAGKKRSGGAGSGGRKRSDCLENRKPGIKLNEDFTSSAKRALAFRRFWLFLLTAVLVLIGLASVIGARFF